jgi:adenosylcobyric acid synthase
VIDDAGLEGAPSRVKGLGHLRVSTVMQPQKRLALSEAIYRPTGDRVTGYEIHLGETTGPDCGNAWLTLDGRAEGAASPDGRVRGCYLHGLFAADAFRAAYLGSIGASVGAIDYTAGVETTLDALADHVEAHLDVNLLLSLAAEV